jgi:hypothetical protein
LPEVLTLAGRHCALNRETVGSLATPEMKERQTALGNDQWRDAPKNSGSGSGRNSPGARAIKAANIQAILRHCGE